MLKRKWFTILLFIVLIVGVGNVALAVSLTSITLDPEDSSGTTTNAPGAWSTNTGDPLSQVAVMVDGVFVNQGSESGTVGEVSIPLKPGINTLTLVGNGIFPENGFYGAVLFFDGVQTPPQTAVYNANGSRGTYSVQPAGTTIMGSANGGLFFDSAPGKSLYTAPDGTQVQVQSFVINSMDSTMDEVSFAHIGPDGTFDTTAQLILNVIPPASGYGLPRPVEYFHFDQCRDGKYVGPCAIGGVTCGTGRFQSSTVFDGIDDRIEVPDRAEFHFTDAMTLAAWVNPISTRGLRTIVNKWYALDSYILLIENGRYVFRVAFPNGSWGNTIQVSYPAVPRKWTHVAGTFDGRRIVLYVDGKAVASKKAAGILQQSDRPLVIGNHPSCNAFQGRIDEVRLYDTCLTPSQMATLASFDPSQTAMMLVDHRLYTEVSDKLDKYRWLVEGWRGFGVALHDIPGVDDWSPAEVKAYVSSQRASLANLEGVLFIGNIKIPSVCFDYGSHRAKGLAPSFYENLDATYAKDNPPADCVEPFDFNTWTEGPQSGPEIWAAFLPVGFADAGKNTYANYGAQIDLFLSKAIRFYQDGAAIEKKMYQVSNQLWYELGDSWNYYGPWGIDFYAVNPDTQGTVPAGTPAEEYCLRNGRTAADCYVRAPMEDYATFDDFWQYYVTREWMGEGWQSGDIYKAHMRVHSYEFVWVSSHAYEGWSVISSAEARALENGGIVMLSSGCNVGRFSQPGGDWVSDAMPNENLLINYLYGSSDFLTATGTTFTRLWEPRFAELVALAHTEPYLGKAYRENRRTKGMSWLEILVGDPFLDFRTAW